MTGETLEQFTYRIAQEAFSEYEVLMTFDESLADPDFHKVCQMVKLAQQAEREACAKVCEQQLGFIAECPEMATYCADAIRNRK